MSAVVATEKKADESHSHEGEPAQPIDTGETLKQAGIYYVWGTISEGSLRSIHEDVLLTSTT